jgi:hypothetical protein
MMSATLRQVVDGALRLVGEVAGSGVQQYGDDRMRDNVIRGFNLLFKKYPWHQFRKWYRLELDGVLGVINTNGLTQVKDFEDFIAVFPDAQSEPLSLLPKELNPYTLSSGTRVMYWTGLHVSDANYAARKLQFYPVTSTGFVNVLTMLYPLVPPAIDWDWTDVMYLDKDMLEYAAAFVTFFGDDLNANAANITKELMEDKFKTIMASIARKPIPLGRRGSIPDQWWSPN